MYVRIFILWLSLSTCYQGVAQSTEVLVSMQYQSVALEKVVQDLSNRYKLSFVYSVDRVPMDYPLTVDVHLAPLRTALDQLFKDVPIQYAIIGGQIALKAAPDRLGHLETLPKQVPQQSPIHPVGQPTSRRETVPVAPQLRSRTTRQVAGGNRMVEEVDLQPVERIVYTPSPERQEEEPEVISHRTAEPQNRLAQISLLPFLSTNQQEREEIINKVSFNLLVGRNGGVEGMEIGGLINSLRYDLRGLQIAGLGNAVKGSAKGYQFAGLFNQVGGTVTGLQTAGLFNHSSDTLSGVQIAGLFNYSGAAPSGIQLAGLFNTSRQQTRTQISGLFNVAGDVNGAQVSSLLNSAKKVNGFQLGLINVADTSKVSIGLINIIGRGYNRFEVSASEGLQGNMALKLGTQAFYNIFQVGARWDDLERTENGEVQTGTFMTWGLGYGIGSAARLGRRTLLNFEAVALHINEQEEWTKALNLLGQLRLQLDQRIGRRMSFFAGPVLNAMWSELYFPEPDRYGSILAPYTWVDEQRGNVNFKVWMGFSAGIRL